MIVAVPKSSGLKWWRSAGGGAGPRMRSSRSSWRAYRRRANSRQQLGGTAFRARCCCDGDCRFGLSRRCRPSTWLCTGDGGRGVRSDALSSRAGQRRRVDRDRVCCRGSDAGHGHARRGHAEGRRGGAGRWTRTVIPIASGVRVWIATGHTDMSRGMNSLALLVQEAFRRAPHGDDGAVSEHVRRHPLGRQ